MCIDKVKSLFQINRILRFISRASGMCLRPHPSVRKAIYHKPQNTLFKDPKVLSKH